MYAGVPVDGFPFHLRWTRQAVIHGVRLALPEVLPDQDVDRPAVLGVHHDQRARVGRALHRLEDRGVVQHEHARVGHEELERGDPFAHEDVHLVQDLVVHLPDDHVEAVVDERLLRLLVPGVEAGPQRLAGRLQCEVDDRRRAAEGRCPRAGAEVVGAGTPAEGQVHVGVDVDRAGHHVAPRRVDRPVRLDRQTGPDRRHLLVVHEDVGRDRLGGGHHRPPLDQRLHGSDLLSYGSSWVSSP